MALFFLHQRKRPDVMPAEPFDSQDDRPIHVLAVTRDVWLTLLLDRAARHGVSSDRVADCDAALTLTRTHQYDVILAGAPGVDIVDICRRLRRESVTTPILGVREDSTVRDVVAALDGGADGYVVGPLDDAELIARLRAARRRYDYERNRPATRPPGDHDENSLAPAS